VHGIIEDIMRVLKEAEGMKVHLARVGTKYEKGQDASACSEFEVTLASCSMTM